MENNYYRLYNKDRKGDFMKYEYKVHRETPPDGWGYPSDKIGEIINKYANDGWEYYNAIVLPNHLYKWPEINLIFRKEK